ncbi:Probable transmembrane protein [hydrothermal vent metagenome]|uniref:Probable transmembrane protein n=1 Tax=hydrothermal vent metagenome TaxID=652676 RepID=A0A1W1BFN8_9ZZZZ
MLFWDDIIHISSTLVELVPFSFLKTNGAMFFSLFLYMQVVLLSFAIFHAFILNLYMAQDSELKNGFITLTLVVGSAFFWAVIWFFNAGAIHTQLEKLLTWLPFETVEVAISYMLGFYFIYNMIIVTMIMVTSFFSSDFLMRVREREFPYDTVYENKKRIFRYTFRDVAIFVIISIIAFPLLFIPVINFIFQIALWVWLAKDTLFYDAASMLYKKPQIKKLSRYAFSIWLLTMVGSLFNFIPVINLFAPFFSEIAMFAYLKSKRDEVVDV